MSTIESSVTRVIVATKHLLESLNQWAKHTATESDISDAYVHLGNEFKVACRAFSNAGVDITDLGDVPHLLRVVLEEALCEQPSQESLDRFLPRLREIIVNLLQNLKTKQMVARTLRANAKSAHRSRESLSESENKRTPSSSSITSATNSRPTSDAPSNSSADLREAIQLDKQKHEKLLKQRKAQNLSVPDIEVTNPQTPKSPAAQNALAQLQKGDSLQRRASRRFSAYQYAKLTNYSPGRDPELPDRSAIPVTSPGQKRLSSLGISAKNDDENKEINIFLKIGDKVKKSLLPLPTSFTSLRLLFVEKFAYSPGSGSFPEIYITDKNSGVSYELEDNMFSDIQEGSILSLHDTNNKSTEVGPMSNDYEKNLEIIRQEILDEQKQLFEQTRLYIEETNKNVLEQFRSIMNDGLVIKNSSKETNKEQTVASTSVPSSEQREIIAATNKKNLSTLSDIRKNLSVITQIQSNNKSAFKESIEHVLEKVKEFKSLSLDTSKSSNRIYMEESQQKLSTESDSLLTKFDDLQDIIEDLRKDVTQRGARPSNKQIDYIAKQLLDAQTGLGRMVNYISTEKPNWKKIWESELDTVCSEQQFLTLQEDLVSDLKEDLAKATETFDLVKQCCDEQIKNPRTRTAKLPIPEPGTLGVVRDAVLSEVEALKPNHDSRVEAIERAEKIRLKEKELSHLNGFEEELGGFVENHKLKKSGGFEEVERIRRIKDEQNLRTSFAPF